MITFAVFGSDRWACDLPQGHEGGDRPPPRLLPADLVMGIGPDELASSILSPPVPGEEGPARSPSPASEAAASSPPRASEV